MLMAIDEFLTRVIDEGIEAAKADYKDQRHQPHLHGSIAGFEACRGKSPIELSELLAEARKSSEESFRQREEKDTYWFKRCYTLEVEWVCNVVSAALVSLGMVPISDVTARGLMKAAEILGVK